MRTTWFLCRTKPQQESYAAANCKRMGAYSTFLPMMFCNERQREVPLFPTYLFVQTYGAWYFLQSTWGIVKVIMRGDAPDTIPHKVIRGLRGMVNEEGVVELPATPKFQKGQPLRITKGAFADWVGLYQNSSDNHRVRVLLNLLGRQTLITLSAYQVEAA